VIGEAPLVRKVGADLLRAVDGMDVGVEVDDRPRGFSSPISLSPHLLVRLVDRTVELLLALGIETSEEVSRGEEVGRVIARLLRRRPTAIVTTSAHGSTRQARAFIAAFIVAHGGAMVINASCNLKEQLPIEIAVKRFELRISARRRVL